MIWEGIPHNSTLDPLGKVFRFHLMPLFPGFRLRSPKPATLNLKPHTILEALSPRP